MYLRYCPLCNSCYSADKWGGISDSLGQDKYISHLSKKSCFAVFFCLCKGESDVLTAGLDGKVAETECFIQELDGGSRRLERNSPGCRA